MGIEKTEVVELAKETTDSKWRADDADPGKQWRALYQGMMETSAVGETKADALRALAIELEDFDE